MQAGLTEAALLAAVAMLAVSALVWPLRVWLLHQQLIDFPEARRSHQHPTPRGGGLAIVIVLTLLWLLWPGALAAWWPAMFPVLAMAVLGWIDDRRGVSTRWRLIWQALVAVIFLGLVGGMGSVRVFGVELGPAWLWTGLAVLAVVWLINLHNFMDGSDGLASAQGCWTTLLMGLLFARAGQLELAGLAWAACGAWAGFLIWNRPPARVFMGDVGSLALGALIAGLAVSGVTVGAFSVWTSLMVCAVFVVDATATLLSRLWFRERWYTAHRQHAYQRLLDLGLRHGQVLGVYMLINVLVVLPMVAAAQRWPRLDTLLAFGLATMLVVGWQAVQSAAKANNNKVHCD